MNAFENYWDFLMKRSQRGIMTVQEKYELGHIFALASTCETYLEVGTAEGNSLYVIGHLAKHCTSIDIREQHTAEPLKEVLDNLTCGVTLIDGNSHDPKVIDRVKNRSYDCVMIDAGHSYEDVIKDAENYAQLAKQYVFFHDIQLPAVKRAVDEYVEKHRLKGKYRTFINSESFGYGIIEC